MSDLKNIIEGCLKGNRRDQELLYRRSMPRMYGVCLRYADSEDEANDILQDGYIRIFENLHDYKFEGSFEGWMRKIVVNTALEKYRGRHKLYRVDDVDNVEEVGVDVEVEEYKGLEVEDLMALIQSLPPQYKIVFNLFAIEGFSHKEISEKLGIMPTTSKSNLSRARSILQRKVELLLGIREKALNG